MKYTDLENAILQIDPASFAPIGEPFVLEFNDHYSFDGFKKKWRLKVIGRPYKEKDAWIIPVETVDIFDETNKGQ